MHYKPGQAYKNPEGEIILIIKNFGVSPINHTLEYCLYVSTDGLVLPGGLHPRLRVKVK